MLMIKEMMISEMFKLCEGYYSQKHEITKCQVILKAFLAIYNPTKHVTLSPYASLHCRPLCALQHFLRMCSEMKCQIFKVRIAQHSKDKLALCQRSQTLDGSALSWDGPEWHLALP